MRRGHADGGDQARRVETLEPPGAPKLDLVVFSKRRRDEKAASEKSRAADAAEAERAMAAERSAAIERAVAAEEEQHERAGRAAAAANQKWLRDRVAKRGRL